MTFRRNLAFMVLASMGFALGTHTPIVAQETVTKPEFDGAKVRLYLAGQLRTHSQQLSANACKLIHDFDAQNARKDIDGSLAEMARILDLLEAGSEKFGLPNPERNSGVLEAIQNVEGALSKNTQLIKSIYSSDDYQTLVPVYMGQSSELFDASELLIAEIIGIYSNPAEMLSRDAFTINVGVRQIQLSQKIAQTICGIVNDSDDFGTENAFYDLADLFENSLNALQQGNPTVGISYPPNGYIMSRLSDERYNWLQVKYGGLDGLNQQDAIRRLAELDKIRLGMTNVVTLFMLSSPGQKETFKFPVNNYVQITVDDLKATTPIIEALKKASSASVSPKAAEGRAINEEWTKQLNNELDRPMVEKVSLHELSSLLANLKDESAGLITDVILVDEHGFNVAASHPPKLNWHANTKAWKSAITGSSPKTVIDPIKLNKRTGLYQTFATVPLYSDGTNKPIGAVIFGVNVQAFL